MNLYKRFIDRNNTTYLLYIFYEITHWNQVKFLEISPYFFETKYQKTTQLLYWRIYNHFKALETRFYSGIEKCLGRVLIFLETVARKKESNFL